ncbi:TPA: hypothetical protein RQJ41_003226 [Vibrio vulnificus]|nr:hypothetical protein [Vibrio vulnificus]
MISSLKSIIDCSITLKHSQNLIEFIENEQNALLKKVIFKLSTFSRGSGGQLTNAVIIEGDNKSLPNFNQFSFYLNKKCGDVTRQCDYIVFHQKEDTLRVILCELKTSDTSGDIQSRIHNQFKFSRCFGEYLVAVAEEYCRVSGASHSCSNITYHNVAFVRMPNVAIAAPLGMTPGSAPVNTLRSSVQNNIKSLFVHTDRNGHASLNWQQFMINV